MMRRCSSLLVTLALLAAPLAVRAADAAPTPAPAPNAAEATFVTTVTRELPQRYPNPTAATKAGYVRYTNEDRTGAISYVNIAHWDTTDPAAPAQLWYDVHGRLLGADFSVRQADAPNGPSLFGIDPKRFSKIPAHVHYVLCDKGTSMCTYGKAIRAAKYTAAGGDVAHPTADGLVKAGAVTDPSTVSTVFLYPAIYDVTVWVVPNPLGAFADANPNVKPTGNTKGEEM
jgi:hypothetical protein